MANVTNKERTLIDQWNGNHADFRTIMRGILLRVEACEFKLQRFEPAPADTQARELLNLGRPQHEVATLTGLSAATVNRIAKRIEETKGNREEIIRDARARYFAGQPISKDPEIHELMSQLFLNMDTLEIARSYGVHPSVIATD